MDSRTLLLALALTGSAAPSLGASEADPADGPGAQAAVAPAPARAVRPRPRLVAVQPPMRPADLDEIPSQAAAEPAAQPPAPAPAPAEAVAVAEAGPGEAGGKVAPVSILPPLRPTFRGDAETAGPEAGTFPAQAAAAPAETPAAQPGAAAGPVVAVTPPARPVFPGEAAETAGLPADAPAPAAAPSLFAALFGPKLPPAPAADPEVETGRPQLDALIARHARLNGVPASLVHRIVVRESRYNPRAVGRGGAMGLMQIKTGTARALGYEGGPSGLLDAETNITYAVKYLAGAYRTARGNVEAAVRNYAQGYYYAAKRQGLTRTAARGGGDAVQEADASTAAETGAVSR